MVIALVALVGALVALYLTLYKIGVIGVLSCNIGSCESVNTSRWATFLGLPVAAWGLGTYIVILALALAGLQGVAPLQTARALRTRSARLCREDLPVRCAPGEHVRRCGDAQTTSFILW